MAKKKNRYSEGGYVVGQDGKPHWIENANMIPQGYSLIPPHELESYGITETQMLERVNNNPQGNVLGKAVGSMAGNVIGSSIGTILGGPIGTLVGAKIGAEKGRRKGSEIQNNIRDKRNLKRADKDKQNIIEEQKKAQDNLGELEGSVALAQNIEDEFLTRATEEEKKKGDYAGSQRESSLEQVSSALDNIPVVGQLNRFVSGISEGQRKKFETVDESGKLVNRGRAKRGALLGSFLNPALAVKTRYDLGSWGTNGLNDYVDEIEKGEGFKDGGSVTKGGEIKGKGTAKSDSINANLPDGSFIVPEENSEIAKQIRAEYLGDSKEAKAKLNKNNTREKVSNGEHIFTPKEVSLLLSKGIDLNQLAPNSDMDKKVNFKDGGENRKTEEIYHNNVLVEVYYPDGKNGIRIPVSKNLTDKELKAWKEYETDRLERSKRSKSPTHNKADIDKIEANIKAISTDPKKVIGEYEKTSTIPADNNL
jgi:hypothetical protein